MAMSLKCTGLWGYLAAICLVHSKMNLFLVPYVNNLEHVQVGPPCDGDLEALLSRAGCLSAKVSGDIGLKYDGSFSRMLLILQNVCVQDPTF